MKRNVTFTEGDEHFYVPQSKLQSFLTLEIFLILGLDI